MRASATSAIPSWVLPAYTRYSFGCMLGGPAYRVLPAYTRPAHRSGQSFVPWLDRAVSRENSNLWRMIVPNMGRHLFMQAGGGKHGRRGLKRSTLAAQADNAFSVLRVDADGLQISLVVPVPELLKGSGLHARDLIALGVQNDYDAGDWNKQTVLDSAPFVPAPVILPKKDVILIAMGNIKAMIFKEHVLVFEAKQANVKEWAAELQDLLKTFPIENEHPDTSFDLVLVESILNEVSPRYLKTHAALLCRGMACCDLFDRRVNLYRRIVHRLGEVENQDTMSPGMLLLRLLPLKSSLQQFEVVVKETRSLLNNLLGSEDDMVGMLLQHKAEAERNGTPVDPRLHEAVELLVENYLRQMSKLQNEVFYLQWLVQTREDLAKISMNVYRNQMLRLQTNLSKAAVAVGSSAVIAGIFGMNFPFSTAVPNEQLHYFIPVTVGTVFAGAILYLSLWGWTRLMLKKRQKAQMDEQEALQKVFADMGALDLVVRKAFMEQTEDPSPLDHPRFSAMYRDCVKARSNEPSEQEVKLIFDLLDATRDGSLHKHEVFALQAAARRATLSKSDFIASNKIDSEKR